MKVLNRPMFRYGGPIKEGIMSGIKEPKRGRVDGPGSYAGEEAAEIFKNVGQIITTDTPNSKVLNAAAQIGIGNPYRDIRRGALDKKVNLKPINNEVDMATLGGYGEIEKPYLEFDKIPKYIEDIDGDGIRDLNPEYVKNKTFINDIFGGPYKRKTNEEFSTPIKTGKASGTDMPPMLDKSGKMGVVTPDVKLPGDTEPPVELTRKEKVNSILEGLGYDRAQKNALYDAMIKAGQRISRTGLGADNLVSDVIAETSQSYDKPEKLREAANLMQVQQDLKLEQLKESKDTKPPVQKLAEYYQSDEGGGLERDVAIRKANKLPTTLGEYFTASAAKTDLGKVRDATNQATRDGLFGEGVEYRGKIEAKNYDGSVDVFVKSDDFRGDGVYNVGGKAVLIKNGKIVSEVIIQAKTEKGGLFS
jgi:hypothetical protein